MKRLSVLLFAMTVSNMAFGAGYFSGKRDYKVGDKVVYTSCVVRAQIDMGVVIKDVAGMTAVCSDLATKLGADTNGVKISAEMNGYSKTTLNCIACPVAAE